MTLEMINTSKAPEEQSKVILDIRAFGGAPRMTVAHLVHAVH
jgi:hypothetical protein